MTWLAGERFTGTYRRQLSISEDIDSERIVASYDNGVLTVTLPIAEKAKTAADRNLVGAAVPHRKLRGESPRTDRSLT